MRAIYKIARLELSNLFYSPVAWLLLILFVFMTAMTFTEALEGFARQQEFGYSGSYMPLSQEFFYSPRGLWAQVQ
ncbi:MAG: hypothetical protein V8R91_12130 [Butyricimonas faecihominis]